MRTKNFADLYNFVNKCYSENQVVSIDIILNTGEVVEADGLIRLTQHALCFGKYTFNVGRIAEDGGVIFNNWLDIDLNNNTYFVNQKNTTPIVLITAMSELGKVSLYLGKEAE